MLVKVKSTGLTRLGLNRETRRFMKLQMTIDKFHQNNHTSCGKNFNSSEYASLNGKNTQSCDKPTQNWERLQHLAHLWILTCSWQLSHCIWVIKTLPRHSNQPSSRRFPLPCSERVGWGENQAWRSLWGRWRREANGWATEPVFREGGGSNSLFGHLMLWREVLHWWLTNGWNVIKIL